MTRTGRSPRALLLTLVLDYLLLAGGFNALVPVFEQPDEHTHYFFAQHVARTGRLPVQTDDPDTRGPWEQEGSQPPLYYLLAAPLVRLAGGDLEAEDLWYNDQNSMGTPAVRGNENRFVHDPAREGWPWRGYALAVHLGRGLSMLLGAVTVLCAHAIASRVLKGPAGGRLALAAAALVGFNPQFLAVSSTFGNDSLIIALASLALVLLLRMWDRLDDGAGLDGLARSLPALAVVAGLAPLAKISGLTLVVFAVITLIFLAWRHRQPEIMAPGSLYPLAGAVVLSSWWYLRNLRLYFDVLGFSHMHPGGTLRDDFRWLEWLQGEAAGELWGVWLSSWGLFGWFTILLPGWVYAILTALAVLALAGLVVARRRRAPWIDWPRLAWLGVWAALVIASLLRWLSITKGGQGRLLFPAIAAGGVFLAAGLWSWVAWWGDRRAEEASADADGATVPRVEARFLLAIYGGMFVLATACLFFPIRSAYAGPRRIDAEDVPERAIPAGVTFGEGLTLVAVEAPERVTAGEDFPVTLYWRADGPITRNGFVNVELAGFKRKRPMDDQLLRFGTESALSYLGGGTTPPSLLSPGPAVYVDHRTLRPSPMWEGAPGGAELWIMVYEPGVRSEHWPIQNPEGGMLGKILWSTPVVIDPTAGTAPIAQPPGPALATFDGRIGLYFDPTDRGRTVALSSVPIRLDLSRDPSGSWQRSPEKRTDVIWVVQEAPREPLQLFVHLLDDAGTQLATFDRPLETSYHYPSQQWLDGQVLRDWIDWELHDARGDQPIEIADLDGRLTLSVGIYRPGDGSRLPAYRPDGERWKDDAVILHEIEVTD